jgi:hypothetical protein
MDKNSMIQFIQTHADATADQSAIASYYLKKSETEVAADYQRLLIGEQRRITSANADLQREEAAAAEMQQKAADELEKYRFLQTCQVVHEGKSIQPNQANLIELKSWLRPGEQLCANMLIQALKEQPHLKFRLSWSPAVDSSPAATEARKNQVEANLRATFHTLARDYDLSRCEANVQALIQHFPEGADAFQIGLAIQNHQLNLAPCSKAEHLEFTKELEREFENKWKAMPLHEVRKRSAECNAEREALLARHSWKERGVLTKEDEAEARQQAIKQQEELLGFPVMPATLGETALDAAYLRGCSRNQLMDAQKRWGVFQVNQRLVGK